ncbi:MAG: transcription elongation factor subunit Spt4 [Candidatus Asgardarchaeia archaeon]
MPLRACRRCHALTTGSRCPICKSTDLTTDFSGIVIINNPENSIIAKKLNIKQPGMYALKVR